MLTIRWKDAQANWWTVKTIYPLTEYSKTPKGYAATIIIIFPIKIIQNDKY